MPRKFGSATRTVLAGAAMALFGLSTAAWAQSAGGKCASVDDIRVMIFQSVFNQMVNYVAADAGFYTKNCINATLVPVANGPAGLAQLQSGSLTFSDSSFDNVLVARHRGLPIKVVSGISPYINLTLVARKQVTLPNEAAGYPAVMKDLVGKKIGVFGLGSGSELFVRTMLRGGGVDPASVTFVAVGSTPTQLSALENGAVDAVIMLDPGQDMAVLQGLGRIIVDLRKPGVGPKELQDLNGVYQAKVASETLLKEKPDLVRRFLEANRQSAEWIHDPANYAAVLKIMRARVALAEAKPGADALFENLVKTYIATSSVAIKRSSVDAWNRLQMSAGNIPAPIPFEDAVWSGVPVID